ncbi:MAG: ABC transporter ATP-binding protein [Acutalibacteraceae bacterium]
MSDITPELKEELTKAEETAAQETKEATEKTASGENKKAPEGKKRRKKKTLAGAINAMKNGNSGAGQNGEKKKKVNKSKPKDAKKTFKRLMGYMLKRKALLGLVAFLVLFSAAVSVASTAINEPVVNLCKEVLNPADRMARGEFIQKLALWLGLMVGLSVVSALASFAYSRIMLTVSQKTMLDIRKDLFEHLETLPVKYFDTHKRGDIMSRFTSDVSTVNNIINDGMTTLISSGITLIGTVGMMLYYSPKITIILFLSVIAMLIVIIVIGGLSARQFMKYQKAMGECNGYIEEYIRGQRVVKIFSREEENKAEFSAIVKKLKRVGIGANTISGLLSPIMTFISKMNYAICALLGATMIIKGKRMNVGRLVAYLSYAKSFTSPITSLASQFTSLMSALAGAERIFEIMDMDGEIDEGSVTMVRALRDENGDCIECDDKDAVLMWKIPLNNGEFLYTEVKGEVKFNDVSFGYNEEKTVLKHITIDAKPNEKIAFVGSTGAGKTTVTNLINRFYDINEGEITVDGIDIKKIKKDDLRHSMSIVLQDTHLFSGTVADNIRYGRLEATDEEVVAAAKIANADSFITRLPKGYETEIKGDGKNLSQGQRQLISIARAAVADPQIIILDEATSSIDTRTEKLIEKGMDQLMEGRTVFVIAHRLSTVRNSDKIMVLENGEIIESGNHEELLEKEGKYYQLYNGLYELD